MCLLCMPCVNAALLPGTYWAERCQFETAIRVPLGSTKCQAATDTGGENN